MRFASLALLALAVPACGGDDKGGGNTDRPDAAVPLGDGPALVAADNAVIVAHQGDDLRYMQPDLGDVIATGVGVTAIYVTDGAGEPTTAADGAHRGAKLAYASLAGTPDATWACGAITLADQRVEHCRLDAAKLSLVFLGYPASAADGSSDNSLLHLWEAKVTSVTNPAAPTMPSYGQASLIATVTAALDATQPSTLRTLEIASSHGTDHSDHMLVGALAILATAASTTQPLISAYRGDNIASLAANADADTSARTATAYGYYAACATGCAACGTACSTAQLAASDAILIQRHYAVEMAIGAAGPFKIGGDCVALPTIGGNGTIGSCTGAPQWTLARDGTLKSSDNICMKAILTGEIVGSECSNQGLGGRFFLDAENHLWSGVVPAPAADMTLAHLQCVANVGGRPRDTLCGGLSAPLVDLPPELP